MDNVAFEGSAIAASPVVLHLQAPCVRAEVSQVQKNLYSECGVTACWRVPKWVRVSGPECSRCAVAHCICISGKPLTAGKPHPAA